MASLQSKLLIMAKSHSKGRELEYALRRIEESVLAHNPDLAGAKARIEQNKIIIVDGVRHEVDIWVVLNEGTNYSTTHILECKNWRDPVGTEEIGKLAIKRSEVGAHTASLIGTGFTDDAKRLALKHGIKLSVARDFRFLDVAAPFVSHKIEGGAVSITYAHSSPAAPANLSYDNTQTEIDGKAVNLAAILDALIASHLQETTRADPRYKLSGPHSGTTNFRHLPRPGSLFIDGFEVAIVAAQITYTAEIQYPTVVTRFSIEGRGGFFKLQYPPGTMGYENLALEIVATPETN